MRARARRRFFRVVRVRAECGCLVDLQTSAYRVPKSMLSGILSHHVRLGVWCHVHPGRAAFTECLGVFRQGDST